MTTGHLVSGGNSTWLNDGRSHYLWGGGSWRQVRNFQVRSFSSAYCALCVLSGGSWAPCFWGRQGHLPCFPHVGNLFSPAPFSWCFSSLRLGPWSNPCFLYVLRRSVRSVDRRRGWPGEWEPNPPTRSRLGVRLAGRVGSNPTDSVLD